MVNGIQTHKSTNLLYNSPKYGQASGDTPTSGKITQVKVTIWCGCRYMKWWKYSQRGGDTEIPGQTGTCESLKDNLRCENLKPGDKLTTEDVLCD